MWEMIGHMWWTLKREIKRWTILAGMVVPDSGEKYMWGTDNQNLESEKAYWNLLLYKQTRKQNLKYN